MNLLLALPMLLAAFGVLFVPQDPAPKGDDPEAVNRAALDYVDGFYAGEPERVERGVHERLQKLVVKRMPWGTDVLEGMDRQTLVEYARLGGERRKASERGIDYQLFSLRENVATVKIDSAEFLDYAHVVKINGEWRIINVLWIPHTPTPAPEPTEEDLAAIEQAGLDYVDGFYAGSVERIAKALHPRLQKVVVRPLPNGREIFQYTTTDGLVDYVKTGRSVKPTAERKVAVEIHEVHGGIATISIDSADFLDLAHVAKIDGEWKIVNVLWLPNR